MSVQVGKPAPEFEMPAVVGGEMKTIKLSDYRGKWVLLFSWPFDFTGVCASEIPEFDRRLPEFESLGCAVVGFNNDSVHSHKRWAQDLGGIRVPLGGDKTSRWSAEYGVLLEDGGGLRGTWIIDPTGVVRWTQVNWRPIGRDVDNILRELKALQHNATAKEACLVNWRPQA